MEPKQFRKRNAILTCLRQSQDHPTAQTIHERLPELSLATVYRNLAWFKAHGVIASLSGADGAERFDWNTVPHSHFLCNCCGCVTDCPQPPQALLEGLPGHVDRVQFTGLCDACLQKSKSGR